MSFTASLEPFDDLGPLAIADKRPVDVADKANVRVARSVRYRVIMFRIESMRHLDHAAALAFAVKVTARGERQLGADIVAADLDKKADLFVQQIVFVADKRHDRSAAALKGGGDLEQQLHVVAGGDMRYDDQIVSFQIEQTTAEVDEVVDIAYLDIQRRRSDERFAPVGAIGEPCVDVLQQRKQLCDSIHTRQPLRWLSAVAIPEDAAQHGVGENDIHPDAVRIEI